MSPVDPKSMMTNKRAVKAHTTEVIPEPPECNGYMHIVKRNETLNSIAKKFNCSMQQLLAANPQLNSRFGTIFIRQRICIPDVIEILPVKKLIPVGPQVLSVELLDAMGNPLQVFNSFTQLAPRTFIRVIFDRPVSTVYFFFLPTRKLILKPSFLVGLETLSPPQRSVRFVWNVPRGIRGALFIIGCTPTVCGPPFEIMVSRV